jgi:hypothetical protein
VLWFTRMESENLSKLTPLWGILAYKRKHEYQLRKSKTALLVSLHKFQNSTSKQSMLQGTVRLCCRSGVAGFRLHIPNHMLMQFASCGVTKPFVNAICIMWSNQKLST